jgi:hypothetical protein
MAPDSPSFEDLRGLLKEAFRSLGGGEAFLKAERKGFSRADATFGLTPSRKSAAG